MLQIQGLRSLAGPMLLVASAALCAQQPTSPQAPPPSATPANTSTLSSSLGVYVFPAKNQTPQTQSADEASCFGWAKSQTRIDPIAITPQTSANQPATVAATAPQGGALRGAVGGAAGGAAIGAIAGDAGKGAAIGAGIGALTGAARRRAANEAAAQQQRQAQAAADQQAQASVAQQKATYNKAFSACMEGKGYTVK